MRPIADTTHGPCGVSNAADHLAFLGVPYAAAAGGDAALHGTASALDTMDRHDRRASTSVMRHHRIHSCRPAYRATVPESEDCLSLNVYTPALDDARRPGPVLDPRRRVQPRAGSQPTYDGGPLVERGDVVVVTINYRVGALGYLYLGGHGGAEWGAAPNVGQLDQIAALRVGPRQHRPLRRRPRATSRSSASPPAASPCRHCSPCRRRTCCSTRRSRRAAPPPGSATPTWRRAVAGAYLERLGIPDADPRRCRAVGGRRPADGRRALAARCRRWSTGTRCRRQPLALPSTTATLATSR